ncbi:DUF6175 family protein [Arcicella sp. DC2W]|uniref:DUF6175 family protein n=1 Tax=Arcicella gelida TaxID=2984195 RepID=A0ABU5RZA0_9BACT|nr:DUF6175 family protein [Arcicella sp. DC2W]MEA5401542.1 DUF6175 family protein [Arcicella sp. DC2W]
MCKKISLLIFLSFVAMAGFAQNKTDVKTNETLNSEKNVIVRPTIMVFPFFKEGQNIRTLVEDDVNTRLVMAKVKEAFDKRGYSTIDFLSKVRNLAVNEVLNSEAQSDLKTQIIQSSGTDICVEVEYSFLESNSGNEVKLVLNSYESSTSSTLSNKVGFSGKFYSQDIGKLAARANDSVIEDFLNVMQQKFTDIIENGRYLSLEFNLAASADIKMSSEVTNEKLPLSDALELWVAEHTKNYHIQGVTDLKVLFDVIRVPRLDASGKMLTTTRYSLDIFRFCNTLFPSEKPDKKLKVERLIKGNTIFITFK